MKRIILCTFLSLVPAMSFAAPGTIEPYKEIPQEECQTFYQVEEMYMGLGRISTALTGATKDKFFKAIESDYGPPPFDVYKEISAVTLSFSKTDVIINFFSQFGCSVEFSMTESIMTVTNWMAQIQR